MLHRRGIGDVGKDLGDVSKATSDLFVNSRKGDFKALGHVAPSHS